MKPQIDLMVFICHANIGFPMLLLCWCYIPSLHRVMWYWSYLDYSFVSIPSSVWWLHITETRFYSHDSSFVVVLTITYLFHDSVLTVSVAVHQQELICFRAHHLSFNKVIRICLLSLICCWHLDLMYLHLVLYVNATNIYILINICVYV